MTLIMMDARAVLSTPAPAKTPQRSGLQRLIAAAVVSSQFREKLLFEPEVAMSTGYLGQVFPLTEQEKTIIRTVRAKDLTDFAQKVNQALKTI